MEGQAIRRTILNCDRDQSSSEESSEAEDTVLNKDVSPVSEDIENSPIKRKTLSTQESSETEDERTIFSLRELKRLKTHFFIKRDHILYNYRAH